MRLTFWNERKAHYDWHCENNEIADKLAAYEDTELSPEEFKEKSERVLELYGKLKPYADAEDRGRLVILPCKVGDVIWWKNGHHIVYDCHVVEVQISSGRSEVIFKFGPQLDIKAGARFEDFGKTVFITREEAESALKGGQMDV